MIYDWTRYVRQLYTLALDLDVFGADPFAALETVGMALERTHAGMSQDDAVCVGNVIGWYRERAEVAEAEAV